MSALGGRGPPSTGPGRQRRRRHRHRHRHPALVAAPPAFRRCPSTSASVSAVANTALPQAPHNDSARNRRPRGGTPPHLVLDFARPSRELSLRLPLPRVPYPRARLCYLNPLLVSPAFRHVGRSARFPLTWR